MIVWLLNLQLFMQSVPIITNVVSSNPVQVMCIRCNIKFVSDLRQVSGFFRVIQFPPTIKLAHDITEILLKVAFNTINQSTTIYLTVITYIQGGPEICHRSMKFLFDTNSLLFCHYF